MGLQTPASNQPTAFSFLWTIATFHYSSTLLKFSVKSDHFLTASHMSSVFTFSTFSTYIDAYALHHGNPTKAPILNFAEY